MPGDAPPASACMIAARCLGGACLRVTTLLLRVFEPGQRARWRTLRRPSVALCADREGATHGATHAPTLVAASTTRRSSADLTAARSGTRA